MQTLIASILESPRFAAILLLLLLIARLPHLGADPPIGLSASSDVYTDPAMYTLFARQYVQTGEFDPFDDHRLTLYLKSSVTAVATVVFKLFGTGPSRMQAIGVFFSFGSLLFFFLFVRRAIGKCEAALFLLLAGFNYNLVFYGRLVFLEHAMTFFAFLALVLIVCERGRFNYFLAGISLGVSILFGKAPGIVMLPVLGGYYAVRCAVERHQINWRKIIALGAGLAGTALVWYLLVYLSSPDDILTFWREQSLTAHGTPDAFDSLNEFLTSWFTFGIDSYLQPRMIAVSALTTVFIAWTAYRLTSSRVKSGERSSFRAGHVLLALMVTGFVAALFLWNYRPLRYQLVIIYPACAAAAVVIVRLFKSWTPKEFRRIPWLFFPVLFVTIIPELYRLSNSVVGLFDYEMSFEVDRDPILLTALSLCSVVALAILYYRRNRLQKIRPIVLLLAVSTVLLTVSKAALPYLKWIVRPAYVGQEIGRDLTQLLPKNAVLSGPFAPAFTQGTSIKTVIHMFGMPNPDPNLFKRFPITHLLLDRANELRAFEDYPEVMDSSAMIASYKWAKTDIELFRIAEYTGNDDVLDYKLSPYEQAQQKLTSEDSSGAETILREFLVTAPDNYSANLLLSELLEDREEYSEAERMLRRAVDASPTSYTINERLAQFYLDQYRQTDTLRYRELALRYYEHAVDLAPGISSLQRRHRTFLEELGAEPDS